MYNKIEATLSAVGRWFRCLCASVRVTPTSCNSREAGNRDDSDAATELENLTEQIASEFCELSGALVR